MKIRKENKKMQRIYFVLHCATQCPEIIKGVKPKILFMEESSIIAEAKRLCARSGESLEIWAKHSDDRSLNDDDILKAAAAKLRDKGQLFKIWFVSPETAAEFVEVAEYYGVGKEAKELVAALRIKL